MLSPSKLEEACCASSKGACASPAAPKELAAKAAKQPRGRSGRSPPAAAEPPQRRSRQRPPAARPPQRLAGGSPLAACCGKRALVARRWRLAAASEPRALAHPSLLLRLQSSQGPKLAAHRACASPRCPYSGRAASLLFRNSLTPKNIFCKYLMFNEK